jgi:hypothetical protein
MIRRYPLDASFPWTTRDASFLQYAEVYKDCIETSMDKFRISPPIHDYALAPLLLLLRHYIELQLKGIIVHCKDDLPNTDKHHDIGNLFRKAVKTVAETYGQSGKPNDDTESFIMELSKFDPEGEAFRYPETRDGKEFSKKIEIMNKWLYENLTDLQQLSEVIAKTIEDLEGLEDFIDEIDEAENEARESMQ